MAGLTEIGGAYALVGGDLARRAFRENGRHRPAPLIRSAKAKTRSMSCSMRRIVDVARQFADDRENPFALAFGNAGGRLVEEEDRRAGGNRERDLEEALPKP